MLNKLIKRWYIIPLLTMALACSEVENVLDKQNNFVKSHVDLVPSNSYARSSSYDSRTTTTYKGYLTITKYYDGTTTVENTYDNVDIDLQLQSDGNFVFTREVDIDLAHGMYKIEGHVYPRDDTSFTASYYISTQNPNDISDDGIVPIYKDVFGQPGYEQWQSVDLYYVPVVCYESNNGSCDYAFDLSVETDVNLKINFGSFPQPGDFLDVKKYNKNSNGKCLDTNDKVNLSNSSASTFSFTGSGSNQVINLNYKVSPGEDDYLFFTYKNATNKTLGESYVDENNCPALVKKDMAVDLVITGIRGIDVTKVDNKNGDYKLIISTPATIISAAAYEIDKEISTLNCKNPDESSLKNGFNCLDMIVSVAENDIEMQKETNSEAFALNTMKYIGDSQPRNSNFLAYATLAIDEEDLINLGFQFDTYTFSNGVSNIRVEYRLEGSDELFAECIVQGVNDGVTRLNKLICQLESENHNYNNNNDHNAEVDFYYPINLKFTSALEVVTGQEGYGFSYALENSNTSYDIYDSLGNKFITTEQERNDSVRVYIKKDHVNTINNECTDECNIIISGTLEDGESSTDPGFTSDKLSINSQIFLLQTFDINKTR